MNPLVKKVPWKLVCKVAGITLVGVSSVMSAMDTDEKTQALVKKLAEKSVTMFEKQGS